MRAITLLLAGVLCVGFAAGCGSETDKKNINKDKDRPVPQTLREKAPAPPGEPDAKRERPRGL
jgi:hypothetical protein